MLRGKSGYLRPLATVAGALAMLSLMQGCASIVNGQNQSLSVETPGCVGASCELANDKGKWFVSATPGSVTVNRSYGDLLVKCTKDDIEPGIQSVQSKTKGMAFGNIIFGGIIGAGVDIANGSAYDYPSEIKLPMVCDGSAKLAEPVLLGCTVKDLVEVEGGVPGYTGSAGVVVGSVTEGGLAARSGLRVGDLLLEFNGKAIANSQVLKDFLVGQNPKEPFRMKYLRGGDAGELELLATKGGVL